MRMFAAPTAALADAPAAPRPRTLSALRSCALAVIAIGLVAGSSTIDAKPKGEQRPLGLLASVAIGPAATLRGLQSYAEAINPGSSAALSDAVLRGGLAQLVGAQSLDGLDPASWVYVVVVDHNGSPAPGLVVKVRDGKALAASLGPIPMIHRAGWAVIAPQPVLDQVGSYALAAIATQPTPALPTATVYLPQVMTRYQPEIAKAYKQVQVAIEQANTGAMGAAMTSYFEGLSSLVSDSDKLVVTLDATAGMASLDLALTPKPGSRLAGFAALQHPTDYALLDRLPNTAPALLLAGHLELGPYRDGILAAMAAMYGPDASRDLLAALDSARRAMTGDIAMTMQLGRGTGMSFTQLYGVADPTAASKAIGNLLGLFKSGRTIEAMNVSTTIRSNPGTTTHDGVALSSYESTSDLSKAAPAQRQAVEAMMGAGPHRAQLATFDRVTMVVLAPDSLAEAKRTIDAARGKSARFAAGKALASLLATSRAHKDSIAMTMDLGAILAMTTGAKLADLPLLFSLGFADRNAHIRIALPSDTLRGAISVAKP
jgi:hypothetical protein